MKPLKYSDLIEKSNLIFIAIALIVFEFSRLIFRELEEQVYKRLGTDFSDFFRHFCTPQFRAIEEHPALYLVACVVFYGVSLKFFSAAVNGTINTVLLFYFALLLLGVGGPFIHENAPW